MVSVIMLNVIIMVSVMAPYLEIYRLRRPYF